MSSVLKAFDEVVTELGSIDESLLSKKVLGKPVVQQFRNLTSQIEFVQYLRSNNNPLCEDAARLALTSAVLVTTTVPFRQMAPHTAYVVNQSAKKVCG